MGGNSPYCALRPSGSCPRSSPRVSFFLASHAQYPCAPPPIPLARILPPAGPELSFLRHSAESSAVSQLCVSGGNRVQSRA
jgi:hypothetical protein